MANEELKLKLANTTSWRRTHKKRYIIYACIPPLGTKVYNYLENTYYVTDSRNPVVLSGTLGEQWVISLYKFISTYNFIDNTDITLERLKRRMVNNTMGWQKVLSDANNIILWALPLGRKIVNLRVETFYGSVLYANRPGVNHLYGDFILAEDGNRKPNLERLSVINGAVFPRTYDLHAFPNIFRDADYKEYELVKPRSLLSQV